MKRALLIALLFFLSLPLIVQAQDEGLPASETPIVIHTVRAGDTLFGIAQQYDTSVSEIASRNSFNPDTTLSIGQQIIISGVATLPDGVQRITDPTLLNLPDLPPVPKVYLVQGGDSIPSVAEQLGVTVEQLLRVNNVEPDASLNVGQSLFIPDAVGDLYALDYVVEIGDSLEGIAAGFNTMPQFISADNRLLNPDRLVAGQTLRVVSRTGSADSFPITGTPHIVTSGETLVEIAASYNRPPQLIAAANDLSYPTPVYAGQRLRIPGDTPFRALPAELTTLQVSQQPFEQGKAFSVYTELTTPITPTGRIRLIDLTAPTQPYFYDQYAQTFPFLPYENGYLAIVGLDAFTRPGLYTLDVFTTESENPILSQVVRVAGIDYGFQAIPLFDDTGVRAAENNMLTPIYQTITPQPLWNLTAPFASPLDINYISAIYGSPRSYAGAPVSIFHTGVDYGAPVNTPIRAVADGIVAFSAFTQLRGNLVVLDHGMGVFTSYAHMTQTLVNVGDVVTVGQAVGSLGNTGLSTAAHLHWEVRVRDVAVNGLQWLERPILPASLQR